MPDTIFFNQSLNIMGIRTGANFDKCCKIFVVFFCQNLGISHKDPETITILARRSHEKLAFFYEKLKSMKSSMEKMTKTLRR